MVLLSVVDEGGISPSSLMKNLGKLFEQMGKPSRILVVPPDITRLHSFSGEITRQIWSHFRGAVTDVVPALGTHQAMSDVDQARMFGEVPGSLFRVHNWRTDTVQLGVVPKSFVEEVSDGLVGYEISMEVNRLLVEGNHDLVISVGQVVPHEVVGMANYSKNIFVGLGGEECISRTHFLGAAYGMERIMGRRDTPVRKVLDYASGKFARGLKILYILTVVSPNEAGSPELRGVFAGEDDECFQMACELATRVNVTHVPEAPSRVVAYLDPTGYRSSWLGNKAIYRSRMAIADGGELVIIAPGMERFGESPESDLLIRKYGYAGRERILSLMADRDDLRQNMATAAHLIHGSSDGRFTVTYCPGKMTRREIEGVYFRYMELDEALARYRPEHLKVGWNDHSDGRLYYIPNPALGLWSREKLG